MKFSQKILRIGDFEKLSFSESAILIFFFSNYVLEWMGLNFYYYDSLQPKMSTGIINEHECTS